MVRRLSIDHRKLPIGLKLPNLVLLTYRMWIQQAMVVEGTLERYPRKTRPRRSPDELRKHLQMLWPWATLDFLEVELSSGEQIVLRPMGVPQHERIVHTQGRREALQLLATTHAHVELPGVFFYTGRDHDLIVVHGPTPRLGREVEAKGTSRFEKHIAHRPRETVLRLSDYDLTFFGIRLQHLSIVTKLYVPGHGILDAIVRPHRLSSELHPKHLAHAIYDDLLEALHELHRRKRGYYSRRIHTNLPFDPSLRGG